MIVVVRNARLTIRDCLHSLLTQQTAVPYEIIVVDSSTDGTDGVVREEFPQVVLRHSEERKYPGEARNIGIGMARGEIIAFLDSDCTASAGWLDAMWAAQQEWDSTAGGPVANAEPSTAPGWAAWFSEFTNWMPGTPEGLLDEVPTCNLSVRREVFDEFGPFAAAGYCSDSAFHAALRRDGRRAKFTPSAVTAHRYTGTFARLVRHEVYHGMSYARMRRRTGQLPPWKRVGLTLAGPALVLVLYRRMARRVRERGHYVEQLRRHAPMVFLTLAAWSLGEWLGYLDPRPAAE